MAQADAPPGAPRPLSCEAIRPRKGPPSRCDRRSSRTSGSPSPRWEGNHRLPPITPAVARSGLLERPFVSCPLCPVRSRVHQRVYRRMRWSYRDRIIRWNRHRPWPFDGHAKRPQRSPASWATRETPSAREAVARRGERRPLRRHRPQF